MLDTLTAIWSNWWQKSAERQIAWTLPKTQVDHDNDYVKLVAGQHYVRIWLAEMYLHDQVKIFQTWYPAVHSRVRLTFDGQPLEVCNIADSTKVGLQQDHGRGDVIARNFLLTPLLPLNAGVIEMDAGLIAIEGQNYLNAFIKVLGDFSSLLAVPQLSSALSVAKPLANGLQALFGAGSLHLGLHNAFAPDSTGGYYAAVRATEQQIKKSELWVVDNQLRLGRGPGESDSEPFTGFDYMLFRVEVRDERDDYDMLATVQGPMRNAQDALVATGREAEAAAFYRAAIVAAHQAPEFTRADRARVKLKLAEDFRQIKQELGFSGLTNGDGTYSLAQTLRGALSPKAALDRGDPSLEELFTA